MAHDNDMVVPGFACSDFSPNTPADKGDARFKAEEERFRQKEADAVARVQADWASATPFDSSYAARIAELEAELAPFKRPGSEWVDLSKVVYPNPVLDLTLVNPGIIYPNGCETVRGWLITYCGVSK